MMGFMPAFIESGFAGLIYEIATWYVSSKIEEQVEKINPLFGKILGFAIQLAAPRSPRYGTKIVEHPSVTRVERQADSDWLNRSLSEIEESQRARNPAPAAAQPAASPAEPIPAVVEPVPAQPWQGEPPRPRCPGSSPGAAPARPPG